MGGFNFPLTFLAVTMMVVTASIFLWLGLPFWGALLLGVGIPVALLLLIDVAVVLAEKRSSRRFTGGSWDRFQTLRPSRGLGPAKPPADMACPACGSHEVIVILYGMPAMTAALERAIEEKRVTLGGCGIYDGAPLWVCAACGEKYGEMRVPIGDSELPGD